jgi:hypothetical protein
MVNYRVDLESQVLICTNRSKLSDTSVRATRSWRIHRNIIISGKAGTGRVCRGIRESTKISPFVNAIYIIATELARWSISAVRAASNIAISGQFPS